jgi:hypothetical protein
MYHRWGPSARNSILFARDERRESQHEDSVRNAADNFAMDPPKSSGPGGALALIAGSHKLFCLKPTPGKRGFLHPLSTVMSPYVQLIIQDAVSRAPLENRKRFYEILSVHPHCRSLMGWLLEQQFHRWMGLDPPSQTHGSADFLKCETSQPKRNKRPLAFLLKPTTETPLNEVTELANVEDSSLPIYCRPTSERFAGVDGLILASDAVVLIQVTVSSAHALKKEHLVPLYENLPASIRDRPWKFVWVVPESSIGKVLAKRKFDVRGDWPKVEFYWCRFPFDTRVSLRIRNKQLLISVPPGGCLRRSETRYYWG